MRRNINDLEEDEHKGIKILICEDRTSSRICTMNVPLACKEIDIVSTIFPESQVSKVDFGYKIVDRVERIVEVTPFNDSKRVYQYVIDVQPSTVRPGSSNTFGTLSSTSDSSEDDKNFSNLFNSEKFSDVTLHVKGRIIHAHKLILANKSPVFETMFTHEMSELKSSKVDIEDLDYDTVCDFLRYIYKGELEIGNYMEKDLYPKYSNLLIAADKYCVNCLKQKCEQALLLSLTIENVLDCLILADSRNAVEVKEGAIDFIVRNDDEIIESQAYKSFVVLHPDLSIEILRAIVAEKKNTEQAVKKRKTK